MIYSNEHLLFDKWIAFIFLFARFVRFISTENIALGRQGNMSSLYEPKYSSGYNTTLAACLAFDGYRNTTYVSGLQHFSTSPNCIHTMNSSEEWLQVDLGKIYTVRNITVYRRSNGIKLCIYK